MGAHHLFYWLERSFLKKMIVLTTHITMILLLVFHSVILKSNGAGLVVLGLIPLHSLFALICYWESIFLFNRLLLKISFSGFAEILTTLFILLLIVSFLNPFFLLLYSYIIIFLALWELSTPFWYKFILGVLILLLPYFIALLLIIIIILLLFPLLDNYNKE